MVWHLHDEAVSAVDSAAPVGNGAPASRAARRAAMASFHHVFSDRHLRRTEDIMRAVCADVQAEPVELNGKANHVHLLVNHPPRVAVSTLVNSVQGVSSRRLRQEFPDLARHHRRAQRLWSGSSFAGSVAGAPLSIVEEYLEQQNRPVQGTARPLAGLPTRAFTTTVNGDALARIPVAPSDPRRFDPPGIRPTHLPGGVRHHAELCDGQIEGATDRRRHAFTATTHTSYDRRTWRVGCGDDRRTCTRSCSAQASLPVEGDAHDDERDPGDLGE
jgi:putative transposase